LFNTISTATSTAKGPGLTSGIALLIYAKPFAPKIREELNQSQTESTGGKYMTTLGIDVPCSLCKFEIGESVDWILLSQKTGQPLTSQERFWHGVIVDEWNNRREDGHWFVVKWLESNHEGPYLGPRTQEFHPDFQPYSPHYLQERCIELTKCNHSDLHPKQNKLRTRLT
jgi:hypothetical protein